MIVATLLEPDLRALQEAVAACDATAEAFEIRWDAVAPDVEPAAVRALTAKPLIATARRPQDGGRRDMVPQERRAILARSIEAGFEYVDLELDEESLGQPSATIRSVHDQRATPASATIVRLARGIQAGSVFKLASKIRGFADTLQLLAAARTLQRETIPFALMGLGEFPRALTHLLGARLLYGGGRTNAPGQPSHAELAATLRHWGAPKAAQELYMVVGDPIEASLSPRMHNAAFRILGKDAAYGALRVSNHTQLQMLLERAGSLGLRGLSVTTPLKDAAFDLCHRRSPEAESARAVNCVRFEDGAAVGHNTDGTAAAQVVRGLVGADARILILGSGGAARALASQWPRDQVTVAGRDPERLRLIERGLGCSTIPFGLASERSHEHALIVNATRENEPLPLAGYEGALFDFHYAAQATPWQRSASERSLPFAGGRELLLEQGVRAFRIWTGEDPPVEAMRAQLEVSS